MAPQRAISAQYLFICCIYIDHVLIALKSSPPQKKSCWETLTLRRGEGPLQGASPPPPNQQPFSPVWGGGRGIVPVKLIPKQFVFLQIILLNIGKKNCSSKARGNNGDIRFMTAADRKQKCGERLKKPPSVQTGIKCVCVCARACSVCVCARVQGGGWQFQHSRLSPPPAHHLMQPEHMQSPPRPFPSKRILMDSSITSLLKQGSGAEEERACERDQGPHASPVKYPSEITALASQRPGLFKQKL